MKRVLLLLIAAVLTVSASDMTRCPDGTWVSGDKCNRAPDRTYVGGDNIVRTPDRTYVGVEKKPKKDSYAVPFNRR